MTKVFEVFPELRTRIYVEDIKIQARSKSRKLVEEAFFS